MNEDIHRIVYREAGMCSPIVINLESEREFFIILFWKSHLMSDRYKCSGRFRNSLRDIENRWSIIPFQIRVEIGK